MWHSISNHSFDSKTKGMEKIGLVTLTQHSKVNKWKGS